MTIERLKELKKHLFGSYSVGDDLSADETDYIAKLIDAEIYRHAPKEPCYVCKSGTVPFLTKSVSGDDVFIIIMDSWASFCPNCGRELKAGE